MKKLICFLLVMSVGCVYAAVSTDQWGNKIETVSKKGKKGITISTSRVVEESKTQAWIDEKARRAAVTQAEEDEKDIQVMIAEKSRELAVAALKAENEIKEVGGKLQKKKK